jgi:hypothetical protein
VVLSDIRNLDRGNAWGRTAQCCILGANWGLHEKRPTAKNMKLRVYGGHLIATESAAFYQSPQGIQQYLRRSSSGLGSGVYLGGTKCFLSLIITKYFLETRVQRISLAKRRWERIDGWAGRGVLARKTV